MKEIDIQVRSIKIDLVLDNPNKIIDFFNSIWDGLSVIEGDVYHKDGGELIYYDFLPTGIKDTIFYRDDKNGKFWCNYDRYWSLLNIDFGIDYYNVQAITKLLVDNALNKQVLDSNVATPYVVKSTFQWRVDKILNNNVLNISVSEPQFTYTSNQTIVDTILNTGVSSPIDFT